MGRFRPLKKNSIYGKYVMIMLPIFFLFVLTAATDINHSGYYKPEKVSADSSKWPGSFGFGRAATAAEIARLDIDIQPDGRGLPVGSGNARAGLLVYQSKCLVCHGGAAQHTDPSLQLGPLLISDPADSLGRRVKTIGNYWPYATTVFDYIRRAMPYNAPGSLTNQEVYNLTTYLLEANKVIAPGTVITQKSLAKIKMPALERFVPDDRKGGPEIK